MKKDKTKNIIIILMSVIIIILIIGLILLIFKNELLEDHYDKLEERYEYLYENNLNNKENNPDNGSNNDIISRDKALDIVLKDLKITKNDLRDLDIELEYKVRYNKTVYEISFDYNYLEYEYYLEPSNGKILDTFKSLS